MKPLMEKKQGPVIVSACLLGLSTRHDGGHARDEAVLKKAALAIPVCPEQLGGFCTPRPQAEIRGGSGRNVLDGHASVVDGKGRDVTEGFLRGARETLLVARITGAKAAFLKEKSPSCGVKMIYRGGRLASGPGVTAALLEREGIRIEGF